MAFDGEEETDYNFCIRYPILQLHTPLPLNIRRCIKSDLQDLFNTAKLAETILAVLVFKKKKKKNFPYCYVDVSTLSNNFSDCFSVRDLLHSLKHQKR